MILSAKTDNGSVREKNEDAFNCGVIGDYCTWAVVCDGMGGVSGGEIASEMCVRTVSDAITKGYRKSASLKSLKNLLVSAINTANSKIFDASQKDVAHRGMGTTVVAVIISKGIGVVAHVGDSRAYHINDSIIQLTKDHSLVQFMIDTGKITTEEAMVHPERNVITRAVGIENFVDCDIDVFDFNKTDYLLLCTDGLSGSVDESAIVDIVKNTPQQSSNILIDEAIEKGSRDNITAVVISGKDGV